VPDSPERCFGSGSHAELAKDGAQVGLHRAGAERQDLRDLLVGQTLSEQVEHLDLALRERLDGPLAGSRAARQGHQGAHCKCWREHQLTTTGSDNGTGKVTYRLVT
jgi:hypothetical protein